MTTAARSITYAWIVLCAITIGSWWLAPDTAATPRRSALSSPPPSSCWGSSRAVLVIQYFMAINTAPRWLKLATDAWLFTLWAAVLAIYLY